MLRLSDSAYKGNNVFTVNRQMPEPGATVRGKRQFRRDLPRLEALGDLGQKSPPPREGPERSCGREAEGGGLLNRYTF